MAADGSRPEQFNKPHRKLRRTKDDGPYCAGSDDDWKIKTGITLGHEALTDACEIQLKTVDGHWLNNQVSATTLAVALRDALAELIGVVNTELACDTKQVRSKEGGVCRSIILFDRNAAGYASSAANYLNDLFRMARQKLLCSANCDSVCPHCVLDFDQRFAAESMNRHRGLDLLTEDWMAGFRVPDRYCFFGGRTKVAFQPLIESLWATVSSKHVGEIRVYVGDDLNQWDVAISPLRKLVYDLAASGIVVTIVVPASVTSHLDKTERYLLASMADAPNIEVYVCDTPPRCGDGWLIAEAIGSDTERWAYSEQSALSFDANWGQLEDLLLSETVSSAPPLVGNPLSAEVLRPQVEEATDREIEIGKELDGKIKGFGARFWKYVTADNSPLLALLGTNASINSIRYQDRYFFTPLSARLLFEIVKALQGVVGEERWLKPQLQIDTLECRPRHDRRGPPPRFIWSDWENTETRTAVICSLFEAIGMQPLIQLNNLSQQQHGRLLEITFTSGERLLLRFDQGVSYWRVPRNGDSRSKVFNFSEVDAARQALELLRTDVPIVGDEQKTQLFIRVVAE